MPDNSSNEKIISKDSLALIVGGIFVLGLVFAAYTYFNSGRDASDMQEKNGEIEDIISSSDEREDGEGEDGDGDGATNGTKADGNGQVSGTYDVVWVANDYQEGDITGNTYTVVEGDTLWEIAEAVYGNGAEWNTLLEANASEIGYLPNGQQALIVPGQVLSLPSR